MKTCPQCRALMHELAEVCPACDMRLLPRSYTWLWAVIATAAVAAGWLLLR